MKTFLAIGSNRGTVEFSADQFAQGHSGYRHPTEALDSFECADIDTDHGLANAGQPTVYVVRVDYSD